MVKVALLAIAIANAAQAAAQSPQPAPSLPRSQFIRDMDTQFRKMDADKNGQLSKLEIEQFQKLTAIADAQASNARLFAQLDTDKSGQISPAEFAKMATPTPAATAQPMLARMDGNRDTQISLIEYRTATVANFDRLDADKDGVVTPAEMKAGGIASR